MQDKTGRRFAVLVFALVVAAALGLGACAHGPHLSDDPNAGADDPLNVMPVNYKPDLLAAMHSYLNDPTGIREAGITEPALRNVGNSRRYVICLRLNAKKAGKPKEYAGTREIAGVYVSGRFDRFVDPAKDACAGATYTPFPELEKLAR